MADSGKKKTRRVVTVKKKKAGSKGSSSSAVATAAKASRRSPSKTESKTGRGSVLSRQSSTPVVSSSTKVSTPTSGTRKGSPARPATARPSPSRTADNIGVYVRMRPFMYFEENDSLEWDVADRNTIVGVQAAKPFYFESVFGMDASTEQVYEDLASPIVRQCLLGFNGTIFAYGQTASGKTHTMAGTDDEPGIVPRAIDQIFTHIADSPEEVFLLRVSYIEIYNEDVNDLLDGPNSGAKPIREEDGVFVVSGLKERIVKSREEVAAIIEEGNANRSVGKSNLNEHSSRSHSIFRMIIEATHRGETDQSAAAGVGGCSGDGGDGGNLTTTKLTGGVRVSELNLVDLAGSESLTDLYGASQQRETKHINLSLTQLKSVIQALSNNEGFVPYRNSALTKILRTSLGGNAKTAVICTISPAAAHAKQSKMTLIFGSMAKKIKNSAKINEMYDDSRAMLSQYRREIDSLTRQLSQLEDVERAKSRLQQDYERLQAELARVRETEAAKAKMSHELSNMSGALVSSASMQAAAVVREVRVEVPVSTGVSDEEMAALNASIEQIKAEKAALEAELDAERRAKSEIELDRRRKMEELRSQQAQVSAAKLSLNQVRAERQRLAQEVADAERKAAEGEELLKGKESELQGIHLNRDELLAEMIMEVEHKEVEIANLRSQIDEAINLRAAEAFEREDREARLKAVHEGNIKELKSEWLQREMTLTQEFDRRLRAAASGAGVEIDPALLFVGSTATSAPGGSSDLSNGTSGGGGGGGSGKGVDGSDNNYTALEYGSASGGGDGGSGGSGGGEMGSPEFLALQDKAKDYKRKLREALGHMKKMQEESAALAAEVDKQREENANLRAHLLLLMGGD